MVLVLVIWASITALWGLQAAETLPHPPPLELVFPALDLMFPVEGVKGATQALAIRETTTEVSIELPGDVLFDFDKWDIRRDAEPTLRQVTEIIQRYPRAKVAIAGHTDAKGEEIYNLRLSEKRAAAVKTWLIQHGGVEGRRVTTKGWGEAKPIAANMYPDGSDNAEGRQRNRRVEIIVTSEPALQADRRHDLTEDTTMPHRPLGLLMTLALPLLWAALAVVSPPSSTSAPLLAAAIVGAPEHRSALVIGNAAYQDAPRRTAVHDATDMAVALRQLDFQVVERHDATRQRMDEAIAQFTHQLRSGGVGVFYFSGQGVQVQGVNYLLPVDASLSRESDLADQTIRLDEVLDRLREAGNELNLIILDASRHNPFARSGRSSSPGQKGMLALSGTLIAYATAPGTMAEASSGRNSTYTKHLLHFLKVPGLTVEQMFKEVRAAVASETSGKQIPWESSSIPGEFSLVGR